MAQLWIYLKKLHAFAGYRLYLNMIGMTVIGLLEGAGVFLLAPMLGLIGLLDMNATGVPFISVLTDPLNGLPERLKFPVILALFIVLLVGQAYLQRKQTNLNLEIQQGFIRHLRLEMYQDLIQSKWSFFLNKRRSDFNHMMTSELSRVSQGTYLSLRLSTTLLFMLIQIGFAFWLSPKLTAFVLICGIALILYARRFIQQSKIIGDRATELSQSYTAGITDHFNGIKEIKSNMMERRYLNWFRELCCRMEHNFIQFARLQSTSQYYYKIVSVILIAAFVFVAFEVFRIRAEQLVLIIVIFSRLWPKFSMLQASWEQIAQTIPAFHSVIGLQKACEADRELDLSEAGDDYEPIAVEHGIECRSIAYRYDRSGSSYALQDIDLWIPANSMTAIVGKSGAGKSTLIDILIGLNQPERGEVVVDGHPLDAGTAFSLRRSASYVSQDPFLFHATVRENLSVAAPDATEEEMWEALHFMESDEFIRNLPDGLDTVLGDRGVRLSGGERQRVVLARAILRKPSILVLDEATSSLDSENESRIQLALELLKGRMTIIVIAHRLSTIRHADQVIVLDRGRIIQRGGFQQLSAESEGMFGKLLKHQEGVHT